MQTGGKKFGAARTASLLLQEAGVAGFYRGVMSPVVGAGLIKAAVFGGYGLFQSIVRRVSGKGGHSLVVVSAICTARKNQARTIALYMPVRFLEAFCLRL